MAGRRFTYRGRNKFLRVIVVGWWLWTTLLVSFLVALFGSHYVLGYSWLVAHLLAFLIAVACGTIAVLMGAMISMSPKSLRKKYGRKPQIDLKTSGNSRRVPADEVFGAPRIEMGGRYYACTNGHSGWVVVNPPDKPMGVKCLVYLTPNGFTERQREFYRLLVTDYSRVFNRIYPAVNAAFLKEPENSGVLMLCRDSAEFPKDVWLRSAKIGKEEGGILTKTELDFEYDQDAYVIVRLNGDEIVDVEFYM